MDLLHGSVLSILVEQGNENVLERQVDDFEIRARGNVVRKKLYARNLSV
jgi:hypothetical protein